MAPKISLIIPAYNEEKYIGDCLDSAIKNSGGKFLEIIVADNASTDATAKIVSEYAGLSPSIKLIKEEQKGPTMARERGFREASGDILAFIDADTLMPNGWYDTISREFEQNPKLACLSGPYFYYDISKWHQFLVKIYWYTLAMPIYWVVGYMVIGGNFAIRKDVLEKMSGFDKNISFYGDDTDIARRASKFGKVKFSPKFVMHTSGRRFKGQGLFDTSMKYILNFLSEVTLHKPITKHYIDIR